MDNSSIIICGPLFWRYGDASSQNQIADHAKIRFDNSEYMQFSPNPASITKDTSATLEAVKKWGNYGTVILHTHGGLWGATFFGLLGGEVILQSGTLVSTASKNTYEKDIKKKRIGISSSGKFVFYPSFITKHAVSMKNTFFYLGACHSLDNNTMWNALKSKGAKVGFGWDETVCRSFNTSKFKELINSMLPNVSTTDPTTAKEAYDAIAVKTDNICDENAKFEMRTASSEWENFMFLEGGLINGDFETGDWTGWIHGGDYDNRLISGSKKHGGSKSAALGRWDTAFNEESPDPADEPLGYEWFYQDFVVPENITYLKFYWWMETYDTAQWDWFDAYIKDTNGDTLKTILSQAGKPGSDYGPYWTTSGWQEVKVDISAYRGQKIRIYFDQRLDGYGDQQRVYVDDVTLEK